MKPCPNCKSRGTKIVHMSARDNPVECQACGHRYREHPVIEVKSPSEPKAPRVVHPGGRQTDAELYDPILGEDQLPGDTDYAKS